MAYTLTQEDIDKLAAMNFDMRGVAAGTEAMPYEKQALDAGALTDADINRQNSLSHRRVIEVTDAEPTVAPVPPADQQLNGYQVVREYMPDASIDTAQQFQDFLQGGPMPMQTATVEPRVEPPASVPMAPMDEAPTAATTAAAPAAAASPVMGLISPDMYGAPIAQDPFSNLTKNQRRMLVFAAISDAGAAMAGRDGNMFQTLIGNMTERQDMERKRQAQVAQIQARQQVLGALGAGSLPANATPEQIDAHIAKLTGILASSPEMAPYVTAEIARLNPMRERAAQQANQITSTMAGVAAVDALMNSPDLGAITGFKGTVNEFLAEYGAAPQYSNLMSYIDQLQGLNFLEAYQSLKGGGPITDIEGKQATAARTRINSALKGTPEDLMVALQEARDLFQQALEKNPQYQGTVVPQGLSEDDLKYLNN
jgi:hypothetical protein